MTMQLDQNEIIDMIATKYDVEKEHIQLVVGEEYSDTVCDMVPTISAHVDTNIEFVGNNCGGPIRYINQ